ncbi:MAG: Ig-like domain-containing protein [Clostridia bacterium]
MKRVFSAILVSVLLLASLPLGAAERLTAKGTTLVGFDVENFYFKTGDMLKLPYLLEFSGDRWDEISVTSSREDRLKIVTKRELDAQAALRAPLPAKADEEPPRPWLDDDHEFYAIALKPGKVTLTITSGGFSDARTFMVKKAVPVRVVLSASETSMPVGDTLKLDALIYPAAANQRITWSSGNKRLATVDKSGAVQAKKAGAVKITARAANGVKSVCTVHILKQQPPATPTTVRVLAIANDLYRRDLQEMTPICRSQELINAALKGSTYAGSGVARWERCRSLTADMMIRKLDELATWGTDDNDITVFIYSGHGYTENGKSFLVGTDATDTTGFLSVDDVSRRLDKLKGKVYVMLGSCYSGGFIGKGIGKGIGAPAGVFNKGVLNSFTRKPKSSMAAPQYHVLTASAGDQEGLGYFDNQYGHISIFEFFLAYGGGYTVRDKKSNAIKYLGALPADANGDGIVTFDEAHRFTKQKSAQYLAQYGDVMDVQVYPDHDETPLFGKS